MSPDSDGDGLADSQDACPNAPGPAAYSGCPDSDNDGLPDSNDVCSVRPGPIWKDGCPVAFSLTERSLVTGDFDNDGHLDTAIGAAGEDIFGSTNHTDAGLVHLAYGSTNGPDTTRQNRLTQGGFTDPDVVNLAGGIEPGDAVGATLATGDFNNDGYDDLAVGAPGEGIGGTTEAGMVDVIYGSNSGLTSASTQQTLMQHSSNNQSGTVNLLGGVESGDFVGAELAVGDIDNDGYDDLVIGAPGEDIGVNGVVYPNAGMTHIAYGSPTGFGERQHVVAQGGLATNETVNLPGGIEAGDYVGATLETADFNNDGYDDIVLGIPGEDIGTMQKAGFVSLLLGSTDGISAAGVRNFVQGGTTAPDTVPLTTGGPEHGDYLGAELAVGDINGDGNPDLVIGAPGESVGPNQSAGVAHVVYGSPGGFNTGSNERMYAQQGINGTNIVTTNVGGGEQDDLFGSSLATGDINNDGYDDLAVGSPGEGIGVGATNHPYAGMVHIAFGSSSGIGANQQALTQGSFSGNGVVNLLGGIEAKDFVGADLHAADLDNDGYSDLLVAATGEDINSNTGANANAGMVHLAYGGASGFGNRQTTLMQQTGQPNPSSLQLSGGTEAGDHFGGGLPKRMFW